MKHYKLNKNGMSLLKILFLEFAEALQTQKTGLRSGMRLLELLFLEFVETVKTPKTGMSLLKLLFLEFVEALNSKNRNAITRIAFVRISRSLQNLKNMNVLTNTASFRVW